MAESNADIVRSWFDEFERTGSIESLIDHIHPDFEGVVPATLSIEPDTYRGPEGARRYIDTFYEIMDEVRFVADEFIEQGDVVIVPAHVVATGKETGIEVEQSAVQVWELRDGKALNVTAYATREEALDALATPD
jgi:ketosteroid isomerase-like protein